MRSYSVPGIDIPAFGSGQRTHSSGTMNDVTESTTPVSQPGHNWNAKQIHEELRETAIELKERGLKVAAKFVTEQLVGMDLRQVAMSAKASDSEDASSFHTPPKRQRSKDDLKGDGMDDFLMSSPRSMSGAKTFTSKYDDPLNGDDTDRLLFAQVLFDSGEFVRAASMLSEPSNEDSRCNGGPLGCLSSKAIFLRGYALYLAGERRKEEETLELRDPLDQSTMINQNLTQLVSELASFREAGKLDAFGMYLYGVVLKNLHYQSNKTLPSIPTFHCSERQHFKESLSVFIDSLLMYPYNWSCWRDLAGLCLENSNIHGEVERRLEPLSDHFMYHWFLVHNFMELQDNEQALVLIEGLETLFPNSSYLQAQMAIAYYNMRDFDSAQDQFTLVRDRDPFRLDDMDVFSNILYVKELKADLCCLAHSVVRTEKYRPECCCIVGNYYALKGQHEKAVQYFERALKLDRSFLSAWTLMGHEYIELKNTAAAVEAYRKAVDVNPREYRAWYGLGQTYEILNMLHFSLKYYRKAATLRPFDARIWCAIGGCYLSLGKRSEAIRSYERAVANNDIEGVATEQLAKLYRDGCEFDKAAGCYQKILSMHHSSEIDERVAEALLFLAHYYKDAKKYELASVCCSKLFEYPGPEKEEAKALLREIRSRIDEDKKTESKYESTFSFSP